MNASFINIKKFLCKWLPIFFGCHCREERSFHYRGRKFPICARCTGELVGMVTGLFSCFFFMPSLVFSLSLMLPMLIDGFIQLKTSYESNNLKRAITGFFFGYGLFMLLAVTTVMAFEYGLTLATRII